MVSQFRLNLKVNDIKIQFKNDFLPSIKKEQTYYTQNSNVLFILPEKVLQKWAIWRELAV